MGRLGKLTRVQNSVRMPSPSISPCRAWAYSRAVRPPGPASIQPSAASAAKKGTSTRNSASWAGAVCAYRGSAGFTGSAALQGPPTLSELRDRITNYLIGHRELGLDEAPILEHFRATVTEAEVEDALRDADAAQPIAGRTGGIDHDPSAAPAQSPS